jgi:hypothetical protein
MHYESSVGKPEGKRPLGRRRRRWEDNDTMDVSDIVWEDVDWLHLFEVRDLWRSIVNAVMNLRFP